MLGMRKQTVNNRDPQSRRYHMYLIVRCDDRAFVRLKSNACLMFVCRPLRISYQTQM